MKKAEWIWYPSEANKSIVIANFLVRGKNIDAVLRMAEKMLPQ